MRSQHHRGGYQNIEIIVVNDGATDLTRELVEKLACKDERIVLITQNNQGPAGSRDTGLKNVTGEYIAWCDSDDWYEPDCLETLYKYLKEYNADISVCRSQIPGKPVVYDSSVIQCWNRDEAIDMFLEHKLLNGVLWNKLIKKELFDNINFEKSLWYWEDLQVIWKVLKRAKRVVRFNQAKYNFYVHPESMCAKTYTEMRAYASLRVWNEIVEDCMRPEFCKHLEKAKIRRYMWLFGDLHLMLKDGYKNDEDIKAIQKIMRDTGLCGLKSIHGIYRIYALIAMWNISVASAVLKIASSIM